MAAEDRQERIQAFRDRIAAAHAEAESQEQSDDEKREELELQLEAERSELTVKLNRELGPQGTHWDFVPCRDAVVAVRAPHFTTWQMYRDAGMPEHTEGIQQLIHGSIGAACCLMHPSIPEFTALWKQPGKAALLDATAVVIIRLASPANRVRAKK